MNDATIKIVNFILGNKCNSNCSHCFSNSTSGSKAALSEKKAIEYAQIISQNASIKEVHFNGGEPLLYHNTLEKIISIITASRPVLIKIATGAGEFESIERVEKILASISKIDEFWVSIDNYHLESISIQNYLNFDKVVRQRNIPVVYSICYRNLKEYTDTLTIIHENNLTHTRIAKQPVASVGRGKNLDGLLKYEDSEIPKDYHCPETNVATIWPNGRVSNCSAGAVREGLIQKYLSLDHFLTDNNSDSFYNERSTKSLREIASDWGITGRAINITSPCSACQTLLKLKQAKLR